MYLCDVVQLLFYFNNFYFATLLYQNTICEAQLSPVHTKTKNTTISFPCFSLTLIIYECRENTSRCWELAGDNEDDASFIEQYLSRVLLFVDLNTSGFIIGTSDFV